MVTVREMLSCDLMVEHGESVEVTCSVSDAKVSYIDWVRDNNDCGDLQSNDLQPMVGGNLTLTLKFNNVSCDANQFAVNFYAVKRSESGNAIQQEIEGCRCIVHISKGTYMYVLYFVCVCMCAEYRGGWNWGIKLGQ